MPEVAANHREGATRALRLFDRRLGESEFLATDRVTIADIVAVTAIDFARMIEFAVPDEHAHLTYWLKRMRARPAAKASLE